MTTPTPTAHPGRGRQLALDTAYVLGGFPISLTAFVLVVTGLSLGVALAVVWIGVPTLVGTLYLARWCARLERRRLPAVLHRDFPEPVYRSAGRGASYPRRLTAPLREPQYWLDVTHAVTHLLVSSVTFTVVVTWWAATLSSLSWAAWGWALPDGPDDQDLPELLGLGSGLAVRIVFWTALGVVLALTLRPVVRGMALLEAQLGRLLLTGRAVTQAELGRLAEGRDAAVAAEAVALRRLERDIHDGPQQRLVRLSMDLHRAQRLLVDDPDAARATLAEAATLTTETLEELRALSRGIAPPVLADRGLAAALAAVAARSPVPVELAIGLPAGQRLAPAAENSAYFLVSEALANAAKHSGADLARVTVVRDAGRLRVVVEDDGRGGAVLAPGHGLAGLADRLFAVDGALTVDSPPGGPTRLIGELPCP